MSAAPSLITTASRETAGSPARLGFARAGMLVLDQVAPSNTVRSPRRDRDARSRRPTCALGSRPVSAMNERHRNRCALKSP